MADATVHTPLGKLRGALFKTENGFPYVGYMGVPYAKSPVGDLRFRAPQPAEPWNGERDATVESNYCVQLDMLTGEMRGDEDCLYLNVYVPKGDSTKPNLRPVMVYIHGGGFVFGSGTSKIETGPDYLVEKSVIIVSINYRIGILGFLNLDIPEAAGNMGLKDQVLALKWVKDNILSFGGDPTNVTLFGISAGSASIEYLVVSPKAKGLFHKVIMQSGSCINHWAKDSETKQLALNAAKSVGFNGKQDHDLYEYLHQLPFPKLVTAAFKATGDMVEKGIYFGFVPSIEKDFENGEAFLVENPLTLIKNGEFNKVPTIRGFTELEGLLMVMMKPVILKELIDNKNFIERLPYSLKLSESEYFQNKFWSTYVDSNKGGDEEDKFALQFFSDLDFTAGVWMCGKEIARHDVPVYMYEFTYDGQLNLLKSMYRLKRKGAAHGDDTGYIFNFDMPETNTDKQVREIILTMWTNFAKVGNPIPEATDLLPTSWPRFTEQEPKYLVIDQEVSVQTDYQPRRMALFEELFNKYEI